MVNSWSVTNEVEEELDSSSNEEALLSLLEDITNIWKQIYPASIYKDSEIRSQDWEIQISSPPRMFSYRKESVKERDNLSPSHPFNNSTVPFFYVTSKDKIAAEVMKNPITSLILLEAAGDFCREKSIINLQYLCATLTLTGQMVFDLEFAKQAVFSRHPVMRKPHHYEGFFMKMNVENVLQNWHGGISNIVTEEYFKVVPSSMKSRLKPKVVTTSILRTRFTSGCGKAKR
ncbi:LOW QUALITY PROTEIN: protein CREG2 [Sarcophilus harrisii]